MSETMINTRPDTAKSIHLSASAGSGKTRALKDRYLALLDVLDRRGLNIDQAVAITFTDKAAAEIKERVMLDLPEAMLKKIIRGKQDLRISTIHSFCMNLLKRYPLEAGLPPDFGILDSRDQAFKIQQAVEQAIEEMDRMPGAGESLSLFTIDELMGTIAYLISIRSKLKRMEIDAGGPDGLLASVRSGMEIDAAESDITSLITSPEWRAALLTMERLLKEEGNNYHECMGPSHLLLANAQEGIRAFALSSSLMPVYFTKEDKPRVYTNIPAKSFSVKSIRKEYEKCFFAIQPLLYRLRNAFLRAQAGREAISMLQLYLRAEELYQRSKLREGLLDFDDLEIYAYRLLQDPGTPDILYWLDRKILHFLIDEFQDTSDIQWAILDKLTSEIFAGQGTEKRMPPTLFVVGDEKQSIYRFREANYRLIERVRNKMETNLLPASREILSLDTNYRSTPEVIGTVNRVFAGLWAGRYQTSGVSRTGHKGSVHLIEIPTAPEEGQPGPSEAEVLAQAIKSLVAKKTIVYERSSKENLSASPAQEGKGPDNGWQARPAHYGDCAILIQSRTRLKDYEAALQSEGIPFRVVGGIGFYEEDEVQSVMSILFFLWNGDDRLSLAAGLTSALFNLSDKDLYDLMENNRDLFSSLEKMRPDAWALLNSWQRIAGLVPLAQLIHTIVSDTGAYVRFGRRKPQAIFNIDKLLDTARDFDRRGYTTLQDFVEWVKNIRQTEQREATADMNLPGFQGSVSILTVHKAKGLEFAVVFLPGMNQPSRSLTTGPEALISDSDGTRLMAIKDAGNPLYEDLWKGDQGEQEELIQEQQRLLYVAMTRARDHLIMVGTTAKGKAATKQNSWLDYLHRTIISVGDESKGIGPGIVRYAYPDWTADVVDLTPQNSGPATNVEQTLVDIPVQSVMDSIAPLPRSESPGWKKATDLIEQIEGSAIEALLAPVENRAVSPLTRGNVLHRCLEEHTRKGNFDLNKIIKEFPDILMLEDKFQEDFCSDVNAILTRILGNKDLAWIFERADSTFSELPFLYQQNHRLISGIMDRVVIKDNTCHVVDYKSILIENDEALNAWKDHYRPQIAIYCQAAQEIFKTAHVEGHLLFLDSNRLELVEHMSR